MARAKQSSSDDPASRRIEQVRRFIRTNGRAFLQDSNVTSIGLGYKVIRGRRTEELSLQFTVRKKTGGGVPSGPRLGGDPADDRGGRPVDLHRHPRARLPSIGAAHREDREERAEAPACVGGHKGPFSSGHLQAAPGYHLESNVTDDPKAVGSYRGGPRNSPKLFFFGD